MKYSNDEYKWLMLFDFDEFLSFKYNISDVIIMNEYKESYNGIEFWCSWTAVLNMSCINKKFNNNKLLTTVEMNNNIIFKEKKYIKKVSKCLQLDVNSYNLSNYLNSTIIRETIKPNGRTKLLLNVNKVIIT